MPVCTLKTREMETKHLVVDSGDLTGLHFRVFIALGFHQWKPWSAETLHTSRSHRANKQENEELTFQLYTGPLGSIKISERFCRYSPSLNIISVLEMFFIYISVVEALL